MRVSTIFKAASSKHRQRCGRPPTAAFVAVVLSVVTTLPGQSAQAETIIVNSTADDTRAGHCTLREAINSANGASSDTGTCTAGDGDDTIKFGVTGTITLTSVLPEVLRTLTIQGPTLGPSGIVIDGGGEYQVMSVSSGATAKLANLTIENGFVTGSRSGDQGGGGILNNGTLTIVNTTFSDNTAGTGTPYSHGYGGAIANVSGGTLTLSDSTFAGNRSDHYGAGIYNLGILTITNSTFSDNHADYPGGGIFNRRGTVTVTNTTFFANSVGKPPTISSPGGGICNVQGAVTISNSSFSGNSANSLGGGGGIYNASGSVSLKSTLLADNIISGVGPENCDPAGTITDVGYNISDDDSCGFTAKSSQNQTDPELDPAGLKSNGGPTQTIALLPNSPAIDVIPLDDCTDQASPPNRINTDQRGALRPDAGEDTCDIGAYEFQDFAGQADCHGKSVSALAHQYGSLAAAASAYGFPSVKALQSAIQVSCGR